MVIENRIILKGGVEKHMYDGESYKSERGVEKGA
jgi:hypothetical protein